MTSNLSLRVSDKAQDILAAQALRYRVFYEEMSAKADDLTHSTRLDQDQFDAVCDHLIVESGSELVGTYRLLRQAVAEKNFGFYTQSEFDVAELIAAKPELKFLELGRSCVKSDFRNKAVIELLWQGCWDYVRKHQLDVMIGCASFEGVDPAEHAEALSFLSHFCCVDAEWNVSALTERKVEMKILDKAAINQKRALISLPPLIKGYLRLGCMIGNGAVIDHQFNTIDVLIVLPVSKINPRFFERFGNPNG